MHNSGYLHSCWNPSSRITAAGDSEGPLPGCLGQDHHYGQPILHLAVIHVEIRAVASLAREID